MAITFLYRDWASRLRLWPAASIAAGSLILAGCLVLAENQLRYWRNSESLFTHALAVTRDNAIAHLNLGSAFQDEGKLTAALAEYREALRLSPDFFNAHDDLGSLWDELGKPAEALDEYRQALRINPNVPALHDGIGLALVELGRFDEAMDEFACAARLDPTYPWPYFQMGKVLLAQGRDAEAVERFREALQIDPGNFQILAFTARVLAADEKPQIRDGPTALRYATKGNILSGGTQVFVLDALGMACAETGRFGDAQELTRKALALATATRMTNLEPLQQRLELYKKNRPWRESFQTTSAMPKGSPKN